MQINKVCYSKGGAWRDLLRLMLVLAVGDDGK